MKNQRIQFFFSKLEELYIKGSLIFTDYIQTVCDAYEKKSANGGMHFAAPVYYVLFPKK
jgi:hypothetical protein